MLAIDLAAGIIAVSVLFAIYQYLRRTAGPARWADSRSYHLQRTRENLLAAASEPEHPRDWRPQILAFSDDSHRRKQLLKFSSWIQGRSGLTTAVRILEGEGFLGADTLEKILPKMKREACRAGGDAIILKSSQKFSDGDDDNLNVTATVVRWTD